MKARLGCNRLLFSRRIEITGSLDGFDSHVIVVGMIYIGSKG